ncbi:sigma-54 dependent transcriptional regulator [Fulvivirgaceae bacterium BMA12]|uniref:Sigma-54 dependent transcriptional regulator n=1 Tax=Agaribacillus aureus TaxID=3051825 RepID=A0ABT8LC22_9BACT|nr:sigma-54 dependent transcriptional regulator [Fulvivirgaceae bacterium BMA12]
MVDSEVLNIKQRFGIIGNSSLLNLAIKKAIQVAATEMTVLITGESGSGKESFSKIIHSLSARKHGTFIAINCGAIPEGTMDSELFGHEKGAFTGATDSRKGYFEVTNKGTIFLDEIGEMPMGTQARLLRVLENGEFIRVGSSKVLKTSVRVVAATNVDLFEKVQKGKFREDLYYRLNTVPIKIPPLRERGEDIYLLFRKFATDYSEQYRAKPIHLTDEAKVILLKFPFPGNIRQLKNLVEQISVLETNREIDAETLRKYLPTVKSNLPALYKLKDDTENEFNERDILYKVLFEMKQDMNDLKKLVHEVIKNENYEILKDHSQLFESMDNDFEKTESNNTLIIEPKADNGNLYEDEKIEDVYHIAEEQDESLSIEKKEKELIIKALKKNNNKRKYAAQDLGISERTLYRKIKQYEIEE